MPAPRRRRGPQVLTGTGVERKARARRATAAKAKAAQQATFESRYGDDARAIYGGDPAEYDDMPLSWEISEIHEDGGEGAADLDREPVSYDGWQQANPRITFRGTADQVAFRVSTPRSADPERALSLVYQDGQWQALAAELARRQGAALTATSLRDAVYSLKKLTQTEMQATLRRGHGQISRDRYVILDCPYGQVPLDFFITANPPSAKDAQTVVKVARAVLSARTQEGAHGDEWPDSREWKGYGWNGKSDDKRHGLTLRAVLDNPYVVRGHWRRWPATSCQELMDDLGVPKGGRSERVALLALTGIVPLHAQTKPSRPSVGDQRSGSRQPRRRAQ